eukprot:gnl/Spiro4/25210_TR12545_c0_g1_i1.p1 gnl/Spiro4/25210_TR12545_c0_g1~~gnl/Spiro4/25210_TR12545_c0_g1_i1.p1  ORF type:complete len:338 (-),score=29.11 gnl/Spiro4/25210_TR12545_c0_g1_i1:42-1055(-)
MWFVPIVIGVLLYLYSCGNRWCHKGSWIEAMRTAIFEYLPPALRSWCMRVPFVRPFVWCWDYFLYERNHAVQALYLVILATCVFAFHTDVAPALNNSRIASPVLSIVFYLSCLVGLVLFISVSTSNPGFITQENLSDYLHMFEYDGVLFVPSMCRTCSFQKPARSKHCRLCDRCVARSDHHCVWINNCVGVHNILLFLLFVSFHAALLTGAAACAGLVLFEVSSAKFSALRSGSWHFIDAGGNRLPFSYLTFSQYLVHSFPVTAVLCVFCVVGALAVGAFAVYHCVLAARNTTSNEIEKWELISEDETPSVMPRPYDRGLKLNLREVFFQEFKKKST